MATLLVEIGCEELPAAACREAERQLPELCRSALGVEPTRILITPRRLAVLVEDVPEQTPDQWLKGPPVAMREKAAAGFAKRHGVTVDELEERDGALGVEVAGKPIAEVLPEQVDAILRGLSFSKTMRWDDSGLRWPRPVRWTLALVDSDHVFGEQSYGHRFTSGPLEIPQASVYLDTLRAADVEPDAAERRRQIVEALDALGGWTDPNGVLEEVVYLVEKVLVVDGRFDERYLQLPSRIIETTIQRHIRAFPLGENRFAFVANGGDPETVRAGVENVVEGRLEDASFTFERDVKVGIDGLAERLGSITFFAGGGSYADKTARLAKLAKALGGGEAALEAARLAKADQASELVREFPELEGHVGGEYARLAGYPEAVSAAIDEQYLPDAADAPLPQTETGRVLSAADKIDTLNVSFELGHRPTGSRDPYGLRRAAIGLDRLATEGNLSIPRALMEGEVAEFVEERFEGLLDTPVEYVRAARRASVRDLGGVARLAEALAALPDERFGPIHTAYTRASRLAEKEEGAASELDPALLLDAAEVEVSQALERVDPQIAAALDSGDFGSAVEAAAELGPLLDTFFEQVLVLAEDRAVRANRLRLLLNVRDTLGRLGELSQIPR
ncbi:MAG TPA: glycine--tRNA ligase subunit beta [Gaiellaceae bacterium]|nr:glycine--tRNA ligase subunit beta [Gaiellaceae bacterium]